MATFVYEVYLTVLFSPCWASVLRSSHGHQRVQKTSKKKTRKEQPAILGVWPAVNSEIATERLVKMIQDRYVSNNEEWMVNNVFITYQKLSSSETMNSDFSYWFELETNVWLNMLLRCAYLDLARLITIICKRNFKKGESQTQSDLFYRV